MEQEDGEESCESILGKSEGANLPTYGNCSRSCHESAESHLVRGRIRFVKIWSTVNNRRNFPMPIELSGFEVSLQLHGEQQTSTWKTRKYRRFQLLTIVENGGYSFSVKTKKSNVEGIHSCNHEFRKILVVEFIPIHMDKFD